MRKLIVFLLLLYPVYHIGFKIIKGDLGANPVDYIIDLSGEWALGLLLLTLGCTTLRNIFKDAEFSKYKRMFGLYTFFYATVHLLTYVGLDHNFNWSEIIKQMTNVKYIIVGFIAWVLLLPLALTSNFYSIRLLKSKWKVLHKLTYLVAILAILHYIWLVKTIYWEPFIYAAITFILLFKRTNIKLSDIWSRINGMVKLALILAPVIYLVSQGINNKTPITTVDIETNISREHNYNKEYYECYYNETVNGTEFEIKRNKCNKLYKERENGNI